jgi:predicted metal-binding membrane protein
MAGQTTAMPVSGGSVSAPVALLVADGGRSALRFVVPALAAAAIAWTFTARMGSPDMPMGVVAFVTSWVVMMVAMMLPAAAPVVGVYALAARRGVVAAVPVFLAGYLAVWALSAAPAYAVSRLVDDPLMEGQAWVSRLVGGTLLAAAVYQLSPLKAACLRHCRSPMSFFLSRRQSLSRPRTAFAAGAGHGLYCLGCCWALMAVLVAVGGMQLGWALALAAVITVEKLGPFALAVSRLVAVSAAGLGLVLIARPGVLSHLIVVQAPMSMSSM